MILRCNDGLDGMFDLEMLREGSPVFEAPKPRSSVLDKFVDDVTRNRPLEHAERDRVIGIAAKHLSREPVRAVEQLDPEPSPMTSEAICMVQGGFIELCRLTRD